MNIFSCGDPLPKYSNKVMASFDLLSWGANSHCQLGQGLQSEQCVLPATVDLTQTNLNPSLATKMTGGAGHSLILDQAGHVYSCGWNNKGQTGIPGDNAVASFRRIETLKDKNIIDIACGWDSSMALAKNGTVFAWGSNAFGQLGRSPRELGYISEPVKVPILERVSRISLGLRHSALVTSTGEMLVAGAGNKCQLGLTDSEDKVIRVVDSFIKVPGLSNVTEVACGQHHTVALTENGDLYCWGNNRHGQLGVDPMIHPSISTPLKLKNVDFSPASKIFTGWTHTVVLTDDGKIVAWGRNTYGQLGCEEMQKPVPWKPERINLPEIRQISIGSEHNIALAEDGTVICWGWNEHGNCGDGTELDVRVPVRATVPPNCSGTLVGTGAGHSFAVLERLNKCEKLA